MKTIAPMISASLVMLLLASLSTKADLIQATDPRYGPNSLTIDTATGLKWLDFTASAGLSYQQAFAGIQSGGIFSGFRFATVAEVLKLYSDAGIPGTGYYSLSTPSIQSLISLLGPTGLVNGKPGIIGLSATSAPPDVQYAPAIYALGINYWVNAGGAGDEGGTAYGVSTSFPELGSWLVTGVPEPSQVSMVILAATILVSVKLLRQATIHPNTTAR